MRRNTQMRGIHSCDRGPSSGFRIGITRSARLHFRRNSVVVSVPLRLKKRAVRNEVILPDAFGDGTLARMLHQEALVVALSRAHRWQRLLNEGKFQSVSDLAREIGLDVSFTARILRLTLLAPDIVEAILMGNEPSGLSLTKLTKMRSVIWTEQRRELGFVC